MNTTPSKNCLYCEKVFFKTSSTSIRAWENTCYCSHGCYSSSKLKQNPICLTCGKEFRPKSKVKLSDAKYCSRECFGVSCREKLPTCEICGKPVAKHSRRFCSRVCKVKWYVGDNVLSYLGEDTKRAYPVDLIFWKKRAVEVRARDKICQHCGKTPRQNGRALDVHHLIPYRISKDNSLGNLVALCRSCHKIADANV